MRKTLWVLVAFTGYLGSYWLCCLFPRDEPLVFRIANPTPVDTPGRVGRVIYMPLISVHEAWIVRRVVSHLEGVWAWSEGTWGDVFPEGMEFARDEAGWIRVRSLDPADSNDWRRLRVLVVAGDTGALLGREFNCFDLEPGKMTLKKFDWGSRATYLRQ